MRKFIWFVIVSFIVVSASSGQNEIKPEATEVWEPEPTVVEPGSISGPPSDAIVLFDGSNFDHWESTNGGTPGWELSEGAMIVQKGTGGIRTKEHFGSFQLHIEWRTPAKVEGKGQGRGNSGIFMQERYELQVLDSYQNRTYSNGQAGSIYKQSPPLVNASRGPGQWQVYDVIYHAPSFKNEKKYDRPPTITVLHNGVLIQDHTEIRGTTEYIGPPKVVKHGAAPLMLQDHSNPTAFRNIWIRKL